MAKLAIHGGQPVRNTPFPAWPVSGPREEELLRQVLFADQWGGYNQTVSDFESLFARLHDADYGIAVANGSLALELALQCAGIGRGDEVIVPAHSFIATATAVSRLGAVPVFVDIERETFNIDPKGIAAAVSLKTRALIVVHFGGSMADMDALRKAAFDHGLKLIEDAAHAHGAEWHGKRAGGMGKAGVFSFQNSKAMTAGEGGIVITSDADLAAHARSLANGGRRVDGGWFEHFELGTNLRLSGFQAAVLMAQLDRLPDQIRIRRENAEFLGQNLSIPGLNWQVQAEAANVHTLYLLTGWVDEKKLGVNRDDFVEALEAEGIPCREYYPHPLYKNPVYQKVEHRVSACRVAEQASKDSFWLPQRVLMGSEDDTRDVVAAIEKVYEAYRPKSEAAQ